MRRTFAECLIWLALIVSCFVALTAEQAHGQLRASRAYLVVWTATPGPNGVSNCTPCNRFWSDYQRDPEFRATLDQAFWVKALYKEQNVVRATLEGISSVPTFVTPWGRIVGYTSKDDLLQRLRLKRQPATPRAPPQTAPPKLQLPTRNSATPAASAVSRSDFDRALTGFNDRLGSIASDVTELAKRLDDVKNWVQADEQRRSNVDQRHESLVSEVEDVGLRLSGLHQSIETVRDMVSRIRETTPAAPSVQPAKQEEPVELVDSLLQLGRYPATWLLGPLGGAAVTGLAWAWRRRKSRSREPETPPQRSSQSGESEASSSALRDCRSTCDRQARELKTARAELTAVSNREQQLASELAAAKRDAAEVHERTEYIHVPDDSWQEAYKWARKDLVGRQPGLESSISMLDSLIKQYLAGLGKT